MSILQNNRIRFSPRSMIYQGTGSWSQEHSEVWVSSCRVGLKSNQNVVGCSHDIQATVACLAQDSTIIVHSRVGLLMSFLL